MINYKKVGGENISKKYSIARKIEAEDQEEEKEEEGESGDEKQCSYCHKVFCHKGSRDRHLRRCPAFNQNGDRDDDDHNDDNGLERKDRKCSCGKFFAFRHNLLRHQMSTGHHDLRHAMVCMEHDGNNRSMRSSVLPLTTTLKSTLPSSTPPTSMKRPSSHTPLFTPPATKTRRTETGTSSSSSSSSSICSLKTFDYAINRPMCNLSIEQILNIHPSFEFKDCPGCDQPVRFHHGNQIVGIADQLMKLADLNASGMLSEEEFILAKKKLLTEQNA